MGRVIASGRNFIPEVDGLRFIAITSVVLFHLRAFTPGYETTTQPFDSFLSRLLGVGHYGVELFFILSGFLLAMPFAKWRLGLSAKPSLRAYYLRRLTRLEPPFLLAMLLLFLLGIAVHGFINPDAAKWPGLSDWPNFVTTLFYQHNVIYGDTSRITPVEWSLEIEVQFYLLAPLMAVLFSVSRKVIRRAMFVGLILGLPVLRTLLLSPRLGQQFNSLPWHIEFFMAGFLLADLFLVDWKETPSRSLLWDAASLAGWPILLAVMMRSNDFSSTLIAPAALLCYVGAFRGRISSQLLSRPQFTIIGGMCYSIYLLHYTIFMSAAKLLRRLDLVDASFVIRLALAALITLPAVLLIGGVFFVLVERPCMDPTWPSKVSDRWRSLGLRREPKVEHVLDAALESDSTAG